MDPKIIIQIAPPLLVPSVYKFALPAVNIIFFYNVLSTRTLRATTDIIGDDWRPAGSGFQVHRRVCILVRRIDEHVCRTVYFGQLSGIGCTGQSQDSWQEPTFSAFPSLLPRRLQIAVQFFRSRQKIEQSFSPYPKRWLRPEQLFSHPIRIAFGKPLGVGLNRLLSI